MSLIWKSAGWAIDEYGNFLMPAWYWGSRISLALTIALMLTVHFYSIPHYNVYVAGEMDVGLLHGILIDLGTITHMKWIAPNWWSWLAVPLLGGLVGGLTATTILHIIFKSIIGGILRGIRG